MTMIAPQDEPGPGNIRVTRRDWINLALQTLISDGIESVRVLPLGQKLGVSRSSFYWYFESRQDLLDQLHRVIARHPGTTFINTHFGNNAEDLSAVAEALDR